MVWLSLIKFYIYSYWLDRSNLECRTAQANLPWIAPKIHRQSSSFLSCSSASQQQVNASLQSCSMRWQSAHIFMHRYFFFFLMDLTSSLSSILLNTMVRLFSSSFLVSAMKLHISDSTIVRQLYSHGSMKCVNQESATSGYLIIFSRLMSVSQIDEPISKMPMTLQLLSSLMRFKVYSICFYSRGSSMTPIANLILQMTSNQDQSLLKSYVVKQNCWVHVSLLVSISVLELCSCREQRQSMGSLKYWQQNLLIFYCECLLRGVIFLMRMGMRKQSSKLLLQVAMKSQDRLQVNNEMQLANQQFVSTKMQQNTLFPHLLPLNDDQDYQGTIMPTKYHPTSIHQQCINKQHQEEAPQVKQQEVCDLEEMWNAVQTTNQVTIVKKGEIASIFDEPETLTNEEMELIFGSQDEQSQKQEEEAEDLGQLWDIVEQQQAQQKQQHPTKRMQIDKANNTNQLKHTEQQTQKAEQNYSVQQTNKVAKLPQQVTPKMKFFEVEEKQVETEGRTCLTLGKDFAIYDHTSFLTNCFSSAVYCYFGFKQTDSDKYILFDLTTNQSLMVCTLQKYEQFTQINSEQRRIEYQRNYCLKIRMSNSEEILATIWQKQITNGLLYNIRHYNHYERKYDDSVALVEITDSYIGNNCYCNTNVFISPKFCTKPGQLKMKLSLKNGYLIANMGVSGIKSAPYNCRLENPSNSFVYLLGLLDKQEEKFIVRVGEGISAVVAFATSIGRKRYIDSFKQ